MLASPVGMISIPDTLTRRPRARSLALAGGAALAAGGFAALNVASARRDTARVDQAIRRRTRARRGSTVRELASASQYIGKWYTYLPAAVLLGTVLMTAREEDRLHPGQRRPGPRIRRRAAAAGTILAAATLATGLNRVFDDWLPQPPPPPGHPNRRKPVFPSGHAFGPTAIGVTAAWVFAREGRARAGRAALLAAIAPVLTTAGRIAEEKHWASDVVGGVLGGLTVAGLCLSVYEATRD